MQGKKIKIPQDTRDGDVLFPELKMITRGTAVQ